MKRITLTATVLGLAACGGTTIPTTFTEREQAYVQASSALSFSTLTGVPANPTPLSGVPTSGSKTYSGQMALIVRQTGAAGDITLSQANLANEGMYGTINLTANFAMNGGTLTGNATNFVDSNGSAATGALAFSNTLINRNSIAPNPDNVSYTADFSGGLLGTPNGDAILNGISIGGFADPDAALWGTAFSDANPGAGEAAFRGIFVAN